MSEVFDDDIDLDEMLENYRRQPNKSKIMWFNIGYTLGHRYFPLMLSCTDSFYDRWVRVIAISKEYPELIRIKQNEV